MASAAPHKKNNKKRIKKVSNSEDGKDTVSVLNGIVVGYALTGVSPAQMSGSAKI